MSDPHETSSSSGSERPALTGSSIVALRLLLLIFAAAAVLVATVIAVRDRGDGGSGVRYACPMHPEVRSTAPGSCPICQMALEPVGRAPGGDGKGHGGMAMPDMTAVENVRKHKIIDFVRVRSLLPNLREIRGAARVDDDHQISAVLYNDQIDALAPDEPGTFVSTASPQTAIAVTRIAGAPVRWDRSTSVIRFRVGATAGVTLPSGEVGWLKLASKSRAVLGVPVASVLQSPEGPYVLAWKPGGQFEKRPIEIGETFSRQGFAVVLSGLRASERVVSRATFFLDADRRMGGSAFAADSMPSTAPGGAPQ